jgi:hypothetical protein
MIISASVRFVTKSKVTRRKPPNIWVKADRWGFWLRFRTQKPEGDPDPENGLSPPPSAYPGRWVLAVAENKVTGRKNDRRIRTQPKTRQC